MDFTKKIIDIIQRLMVRKFTGVLTLTIFFGQGGIREVKQNLENKV